MILPSSSTALRNRSLRGLTLMELVVVVAVVATLTGLLVTSLSPDSLQVTGAAGNRTPSGIATLSTMNTVREAIFGNGTVPGYWQDMGRDLDFWPRYTQWLEEKATPYEIYGSTVSSYPYATQMLTHSASTKLGWRGPYFQAYSVPIPPTVPVSLGGGSYRAPMDGWGNPILMVPPATVLSSWGTQFSPVPSNMVTNRWILSNCRLVSAGPNRVYDSITNITDYADYLANTNRAGDDVILWLRE